MKYNDSLFGRWNMRIQKGKVRFSGRELWNLDNTLAPIIHTGLVQFKESKRHGYPMQAVYDYLQEVKGMTEEQVKSMFNENPDDYSFKEVEEFFEVILDRMIFAFSEEAKQDYSDIEECPTICSMTNPEEFGEENLGPDEKGNVYTFFKPKKGYTQEDVNAYWVRHKEHVEKLEEKIKEGMRLFGVYFYSLWD